jgi:hypothetical protein
MASRNLILIYLLIGHEQGISIVGENMIENP